MSPTQVELFPRESKFKVGNRVYIYSPDNVTVYMVKRVYEDNYHYDLIDNQCVITSKVPECNLELVEESQKSKN